MNMAKELSMYTITQTITRNRKAILKHHMHTLILHCQCLGLGYAKII
ncbi:hypothetical protein XBP1_900003 [Xenorhabdus bovienii str. puntauvense]|uniref:Uncharacterized protein n=1 Tax=Xenorhabdus bovienii str. puntauvense TaxID=1398201 RepID=A0A077NB21_XENBV|nr:hypothetical protein XBFFR1_1600003 [Xenorhabdus bovienii str. feltiae France]CDG94690.1 hypothetical protein XBFFL1_880002 [Xenorhabdus bovienii str. feltiae Florida]CDG99281.1 hypothetical protein XBP1_900003 [Xenorhabdus bovienii str. puntauvense]